MFLGGYFLEFNFNIRLFFVLEKYLIGFMLIYIKFYFNYFKNFPLKI